MSSDVVLFFEGIPFGARAFTALLGSTVSDITSPDPWFVFEAIPFGRRGAFGVLLGLIVPVVTSLDWIRGCAWEIADAGIIELEQLP